MDLTLFVIVTTLLLSAIWFIIDYRKDMKKDRIIIEEHLKNQRKIRYERRARGEAREGMHANRT